MRVVIASAVSSILLLIAAATPIQALPSTFTIDVSGTGVTGSGSITVPTDTGSDPTGVTLSLNATIFGNPVLFSDADLLGISWNATVPTLLIADLELASFGVPTLFLVDNGNLTGEADCSAGACQGIGDANTATVSWSYAPQEATAVPAPSTLGLLLIGLGIAGRRRTLRSSRMTA